MGKRHWSDEDDRVLAEMWPQVSRHQITCRMVAKLVSHSVIATYRRAGTLGLSKRPVLNINHAISEMNRSGVSDVAIAERLGISHTSARERRAKMGLPPTPNCGRPRGGQSRRASQSRTTYVYQQQRQKMLAEYGWFMLPSEAAILNSLWWKPLMTVRGIGGFLNGTIRLDFIRTILRRMTERGLVIVSPMLPIPGTNRCAPVYALSPAAIEMRVRAREW